MEYHYFFVLNVLVIHLYLQIEFLKDDKCKVSQNPLTSPKKSEISEIPTGCKERKKRFDSASLVCISHFPNMLFTLGKSGIHIKFTNNGLISLYWKTRVPIQICKIADNVVQLRLREDSGSWKASGSLSVDGISVTAHTEYIQPTYM